ncbi:MAG: D-alanyl-D-alanine carboxypeptidase, partial [Alphaproteobacteria bacterium]|nr:D-alanyl-D-alanine carboxypeptidase [Alphaproteobacteria bacterium]
DELMSPASMSKLMTAYMIFEKLQAGKVSENDTFLVSENAWRKGGGKSGSSTMFLSPSSRVAVKDLLKGIIVQSGNDACITVAENLSGSEENFAAEMTIKARELGLEKSTFKNATGWPDPEHKMTARELAKLAQLLIKNFPEYYPLYSEKSFRYNKITQGNRNPLLYSMPGQADGLKTGHTEQSGFGLVGSAKSMDVRRRLLLVVNGLKSMKERGEEAKKLMDWGFREFDNYRLFPDKDIIAQAPVFLGKSETVGLKLAQPVQVTMKRLDKIGSSVVLSYQTPVVAPVAAGDELGSVQILTKDGKVVATYPVVAAQTIERAGYFAKLKMAFVYLYQKVFGS